LLILTFKGLNKPVMINGLINNWNAWKHWKKSELLSRYGNLEFTVGSIPYASIHGVQSKKMKV
jgi:hypothetical protein